MELTKTARELVERIPEGGDPERYCVNIFGGFVEAYVPVDNALALTFPKHPDASRHVGLKDIGKDILSPLRRLRDGPPRLCPSVNRDRFSPSP